MPAAIDRRTFFLAPSASIAAVLRSASIGEVRFCRVADEAWLRRARMMSPAGIIEIDSASEGATFLGSNATLVMDERGWRIFE